jgi:hypothetical protein
MAIIPGDEYDIFVSKPDTNKLPIPFQKEAWLTKANSYQFTPCKAISFFIDFLINADQLVLFIREKWLIGLILRPIN